MSKGPAPTERPEPQTTRAPAPARTPTPAPARRPCGCGGKKRLERKPLPPEPK